MGCVIETADGRVFEGATRPPGDAHAEVVAMTAARDAGADLAGASVWVTLEPCSHTGRTGPCADALVNAGVARVVVAIEDPDSNVAGRGFAKLRDAGVAVEVGALADEVTRDLRGFITHRTLGRPFVTLKLAMTIDGRTVSDDPSTQWITGTEARADGHRLRAENDAILVGAGTVRADNPRLTTRDAEGPDPLRVVLGEAPADAAIRPCLEIEGDVHDVLNQLGAEGITTLLVEGGAHVAAEFHGAGLVDSYVMYVAGATVADAPEAMSVMWNAEVVDVTPVGADLRVTLAPKVRK